MNKRTKIVRSLPFQFPVPLNIPSSFCYRNKLQIDYKIIAKIGRQSKELNVEICGLPSIATEKLSIPVYKRCTKKIGLYNAKQLNLQCRIDHAGWTSGSIIPIYCSIDNHSSRKITINGTLKQEIQIIAHNQRQSFVEKIAISDSNIIDANSVNFQCNLSLKLPDRLPVIQNTCRTIEINYFVEIKLDIPFALNLYSQLPLIITNSPMIDGQNGQQTSNALVSRQDAPPIYPYSDHQHTDTLQTDQVRPSAPTMMPPSSSIDYNLSIPSTVYPMSQRILHNHNLIYPTLPSKEF
ncbi:arrestin domain-containing protein 5 [Sarcoptes scabiei]|uniref:Arrestin domain-containing protein 5 n=1 Tax=Sarcoptes scabiei TaxID=52283 RepID=A0A132AAB2_SARSC|nr:arrestin domain-containing protein 5 [Sarcoptes scabiei]